MSKLWKWLLRLWNLLHNPNQPITEANWGATLPSQFREKGYVTNEDPFPTFHLKD